MSLKIFKLLEYSINVPLNRCRVNFLKYQKPEKDLSFLKNSETYRTIHHMNPVENGIEKRSSFVAAEADILKVKKLIHMRLPVYKI